MGAAGPPQSARPLSGERCAAPHGGDPAGARAPERTFPDAARGAKRAQTPIGDPDDDDWEDDDDLDDEDDDEDDDDDEEPMQLQARAPARNVTRYGLPLAEPRRSAR